MIGFGSRYLNDRYDAWRTMSEDDYYEMKERSFAPEDEPENPYEEEKKK